MRRKGEEQEEEQPPPSRTELIRSYHECLRLNDGRLLLEGVCARSGTVTHNGRVYPASALQKEARRFAHGAIAGGLALGELDHPSYASSLYRRVSLANASHAVLRLTWRRSPGGGGEGELVALIEVLPTPSGLLLFALAARGVPLASSQRCWAEVEWRRQPGDDQSEQFGYVCGRTLELLAIDVVPDPANAGAWLRPVERRVGGGGGGGGAGGWLGSCWRWSAPASVASVDPSAVALAHLGAGAFSPVLAAEGGLCLPPVAAVVEALRVAAEEAEHHNGNGDNTPSSDPCVVGPLLLRSHYADACLDETPELQLLVASGAEPESGGKARRSLPAHWRRFAERALRCEARERARSRARGLGEDEETAITGCLPCLPAWAAAGSRQRGRQRGRRRAGPPASVAPLRSPLVDAGADADPPAEAEQEEEVDAVLWSRADKARDVRRRALRRWMA